ncbi:hypothetical protein IWW36_001295 [Coemansia brasiliensis]|uniref:UPF3 domain-containing protein n=1 Tax=Coemansia brasiliensis TaxID=2650707 RepID=A0A9W8IBR9_9FUNG|nr:hypothetical protein IWW36_001295 [Coemansia brasiliensis]
MSAEEKDTLLKSPLDEGITSLRVQSADNEPKPSTKTTSKKPRTRNQKPPHQPTNASPKVSKVSQNSKKAKPSSSTSLSKPTMPEPDGKATDKPGKTPVPRRQRKKATKAQQANLTPSTAIAASTTGQAEEKPQNRPKKKRASKATDRPESSQAGSETSAGVKLPQAIQPKPKLTRREKRAIKQQQEGSISALPVSEAYKQQPADLRLDSGVKICVRWLPADLPEHVFWQSIESALPWFDPNSVGTVVKEACPVLSALSPANGKPLEQGESVNGSEQTEKAESNKSAMPLAPTTMAETSIYRSANLEKLDSKPYWRQFIPGKQHKSKAKSLSRAYIVFAAPSEAEHFYRKYHGHVFSKNGTQTRAIVELAPFQSVAWLFSPERDPLEGTFENDPSFKAFMTQQFASQAADNPGNEGARDSHESYAAAAAKPSDTSASGSEFVATPLIKYLHEVKARSLKGGKLADKTNVASAKTPPRSSKPATAPSAKKAREKRSRRQNR